jgi:hypothetical protein
MTRPSSFLYITTLLAGLDALRKKNIKLDKTNVSYENTYTKKEKPHNISKIVH